MTVEFLTSKYKMTIREASVFINWNIKGFVANGHEKALLNAMRKVNR